MKKGGIRETYDIIGQFSKFFPSFDKLDPLVKIGWVKSASHFNRPKGSVLFIPDDIGKINCYLILKGSVALFSNQNEKEGAPLFLQVFGDGEILNEFSAFTPYSTDYGALVVSDSVELLSFPASSLSQDEKFLPITNKINSHMNIKKAHFEMIKTKLKTFSFDSLKNHQNQTIMRFGIDYADLESKITEAQKQRKMALYDKFRNAPATQESTHNVSVLATQNFSNKRNLDMNAAKLKSSVFLREMVVAI